jgi:hypothetical protein
MKLINIENVDKNNEIWKYSNPLKLRQIANEKGFKNTEIFLSDKPTKKYMIFHNNKPMYFGQMGFEDYTKHNDELRQQRFLNRNKKWKTFQKYTPAYLSYHLLW